MAKNAFGDEIVEAASPLWTTTDDILAPAVKPPGPREARTLGEAVWAGLASSATGLAARQKLPEIVLGANAPWEQRLAANASGVLADLPLSLLAAVPGGAAGTAVGGPVVGTAVGAGAAAFAAPMALREALMTAYSQNHARSWGDVWEIAKSAMLGGAKGAIIGGATLGAGKAVAPLVAGAGTAVRIGAPLAAELGALTTTAAALEGHVPTAQDFLDNAILLGGMKGAVAFAGRLRATYAETGKHPAEIAGEALGDPALKAALVEGKTLPEVYITATVEQRVKAALGDDPRPEMVRSILDEAARKEPKGFDEILQELPQVKMEYLISGDDLAAFSRSTEAMFRGEIETQTRGEVPAKQTINEAIKQMSGGLDPHEIGQAASPSEMAARAFTYRASTAEAMRVLREQAEKPETERTTADNLAVYAAFERARMAYQHLRGAAAETARSMNILWQLKYRPDLMPEAKALEAMFEKSLKAKSGESLTFGDIAKMAAALKDPAQLATFADKMASATKMEMVIEGWKAAILSGPQTHMANMMGNIIKFAVEIPETALTTTLTAARRAIQGDRMSFAEYKAKALSPIYGLKWGARDSLTIALEALKGEGTHLEKADAFRMAIPGTTGKVVRIPFRLLQAEDVLFRTVAERGRSHEIAVERAIKEGFGADTREFTERVARYTLQPELGLTAEAAGKTLADIQQAGAEAVFAQRLGPMMEKVQNAFAGTPMQFILPFVRTPANLLSWATQHVPGMNLLSARWRDDFAAGGARRDRAIARVVVGSALAITAWSLFNDGVLTGGGHFDPETRRTKMAAGWQPYSIKVGDTYYSYQRMEPVGKVIGLVADLMEMRQKTDEDGTKQALAAVALFGNATISTTYLSGLASVFNAVTEPARFFPTFYEQYASSLIPKIVGQVAQMKDPYKREVDGAVEAIQSQIPFLREKLLPQVDVWGEPRANNKWLEVMPVATSEESKDKVKSEAMRLEFPIADIPKAMFESGPLKAKERKVEFTGEQRNLAREVSGKWAMSILAPIVNAEDWGGIPDFAKAEIFKDVLADARSMGREAALPAMAPEREKMRQKIVNEINRQMKESERQVK